MIPFNHPANKIDLVERKIKEKFIVNEQPITFRSKIRQVFMDHKIILEFLTFIFGSNRSSGNHIVKHSAVLSVNSQLVSSRSAVREH